jgi:hypothetical protein
MKEKKILNYKKVIHLHYLLLMNKQKILKMKIK